MRRWLAIPLAIAIAWLLFTVSPLWSLYNLADAVRRHDAAYVETHVNFRTLRLSLVRQIVAAVRVATDPISTIGTTSATKVGRTTTFCLTSERRSAMSGARVNIMAPSVRFTYPKAMLRSKPIERSSKPPRHLVIHRTMISMAIPRKGSGSISLRSRTAGGPV